MTMAPPTGSIRDWLDRRASETPDRVSHVFADEGGAQVTWAELRGAVRGIAERLAGLGVEKGDSVAICLPNGRMGVSCLFGALYGGFRATPLNLAAGAAAMGYAISHSRARFALVGVFVAKYAAGVRVAVTGASEEGVFRWNEAEAALDADFAPDALDGLSVDAGGMIGDLHGTKEYRAHLVGVMAKRAVAAAG